MTDDIKRQYNHKTNMKALGRIHEISSANTDDLKQLKEEIERRKIVESKYLGMCATKDAEIHDLKKSVRRLKREMTVLESELRSKK